MSETITPYETKTNETQPTVEPSNTEAIALQLIAKELELIRLQLIELCNTLPYLMPHE